jgi:hypothetical protein
MNTTGDSRHAQTDVRVDADARGLPTRVETWALKLAFSATNGLLRERGSVTTRRAVARETVSQLLSAFDALDEFDTSLHSAGRELSAAEFAQGDAMLEAQARVNIAAADGAMEAAEAVGLTEADCATLKARRDEWHIALEWTDEDYATSTVFRRLLNEAIEEHEAGETVEGGFGR